jgi:gamma-glutamylcyclotransferase (GGCT)/AIG2-like uncharacterized protein YtfP
LPLGPEQRLIVYGTLAPGRSNADQLAGLNGDWTKGFVRGHLVQSGWGADEGYPGLTLDPTGPKVAVQILESRPALSLVQVGCFRGRGLSAS